MLLPIPYPEHEDKKGKETEVLARMIKKDSDVLVPCSEEEDSFS
jgi:hypothetical protein